MSELWDLYDGNGQPTGEVVVRGQPIPSGRYHVAAHMWIRSEDGSYLVQQRSHTVSHWAGWWAATGGSALVGEDSIQAAQRELVEEIGIHVPEQKAFSQVKRLRMSNHFLDVFLISGAKSWVDSAVLGPEVCAVAWMTPSEILTGMRAGTFLDYGQIYGADYLEFLGLSPVP